MPPLVLLALPTGLLVFVLLFVATTLASLLLPATLFCLTLLIGLPLTALLVLLAVALILAALLAVKIVISHGHFSSCAHSQHDRPV